MDSYLPRIADDILARRLARRGAVLIEGPKWCGKTTTAARLAKSAIYMHDPALTSQNIQLANINLPLIFQGETPRLIDEWQLCPQIWDATRFYVDQRNRPNQFILTGSSVPADFSKISHSGAGRIARVVMHTMSLFESNDSTGEISLGELFQKHHDISANNYSDLHRLAYLICRGGWPSAVKNGPENQALQDSFDYVNVIVQTDIKAVDQVERDEERARRLLRSYARTIGGQTNFKVITRDVYFDSEEINDEKKLTNKSITLRSYLNALKKIFVIEECNAWSPALRSKTTIRTSNTHYFTDPSIATAALGLGPQDLVNDLNTMGLFFENLVMRDLRIYMDDIDGQVYRYRDRNGLECDAILHLKEGVYGLVEIKLGGEPYIQQAITNLRKLEALIDQKKMPPPTFKMVICGVGPHAYRIDQDGTLVVPITCLKP